MSGFSGMNQCHYINNTELILYFVWTYMLSHSSNSHNSHNQNSLNLNYEIVYMSIQNTK